jgi:uncharacterized coiled-coil protein SlyX
MLDRWTDDVDETEVATIRDVLMTCQDEAGLGAMFATLTEALDDVREHLVEKMSEHDAAVRELREAGGEVPARLSQSVGAQQYAIARLRALVTALTTETDRMMKQSSAYTP